MLAVIVQNNNRKKAANCLARCVADGTGSILTQNNALLTNRTRLRAAGRMPIITWAMATLNQTYWTAGFLNERFPAPISPLGWSVVGPLFEEYALRDPLRFMGYPQAESIPATRLVHGHPYANVLVFQVLYNPFPDRFLPLDAVRYFPGADTGWRKRAPYPRSILNPRFLASILVHFARDPVNWSPFNFWRWDRYTHRHDRLVEELNARLDRAVEPREILSVVDRSIQVHAELLKIHRWSLTYADIFVRWLTNLAGNNSLSLIAQVPNLTTAVDRDLHGLAHLAEQLGLQLQSEEGLSNALAKPEFADAVMEFLVRHGHRSFSLDLGQPTFAEDPPAFLRLLQHGTELGPSGWTSESAANAIRSSFSPMKRIILSVVLRFARRYAAMREDQRYYWQKSLAVTRRAYLMLGKYVNERTWTSSKEDIFFATASEISAYFDGRMAGPELGEVILSRRELWRKYETEYTQSPERAYPAFLLDDQPVRGAPAGPADIWQGRGVSPGLARGHARVIMDARELSRVSMGEVLVAPATDPGWTPVFDRLTALVVERGGVLAHSAIVAREHGLPAVAGISNITSELSDGDLIEVDGTAGVVRKITPQQD
jgi:rifampicin phosphotransferase